MPIRFYQPFDGGAKLRLYIDPQEFDQVTDQADHDLVVEKQQSSDELRTQLAIAEGFNSLEQYDTFLEDKRWELADRLDYYGYANRDEVITVRDGAWFIPEAVEAICGEEPGSEAANMIDGNNATFWEHFTDEQHSIDLRVRDYRKRMTKIRIRIDANTRSKLTGIDVYAANVIGGLDLPSNQVVFDAALTVEQAWNEVEFSQSKNVRYLRISGFGSQHPGNEVRIRMIEVWVTTRDP